MVRAKLSRAVVLAKALEIADADGLPALTMRRLAGELDVEAMSLYNHVSHKRDLHQGLVDLVWGEVDPAADADDWRTGVSRMATSTYRALLAHPWFLSLPVTYGGVNRLHVIDAMLAHLRGGDISPDAAFHALHVIDGYVAGYAWQAISYLSADETEERARQTLSQVDTDALPHLMEHVQQHMDATEEEDGFAYGLDLLLEGLAARS